MVDSLIVGKPKNLYFKVPAVRSCPLLPILDLHNVTNEAVGCRTFHEITLRREKVL